MTSPDNAYSAQRHATRAPVDLHVRLQADGSLDLIDGRCNNVSIGGMFVITDAFCQAGEQMQFELEIGDGIAIKGRAEAIWRQQGDLRRKPGIGFRFRYLEQRDRQAIFKLVSRHIKDRLAARQPITSQASPQGEPSPMLRPPMSPQATAPEPSGPPAFEIGPPAFEVGPLTSDDESAEFQAPVNEAAIRAENPPGGAPELADTPAPLVTVPIVPFARPEALKRDFDDEAQEAGGFSSSSPLASTTPDTSQAGQQPLKLTPPAPVEDLAPSTDTTVDPEPVRERSFESAGFGPPRERSLESASFGPASLSSALTPPPSSGPDPDSFEPFPLKPAKTEAASPLETPSGESSGFDLMPLDSSPDLPLSTPAPSLAAPSQGRVGPTILDEDEAVVDSEYSDHLGEDHFDHRPAPRRDWPMPVIVGLLVLFIGSLAYLFGGHLFDLSSGIKGTSGPGAENPVPEATQESGPGSVAGESSPGSEKAGTKVANGESGKAAPPKAELAPRQEIGSSPKAGRSSSRSAGTSSGPPPAPREVTSAPGKGPLASIKRLDFRRSGSAVEIVVSMDRPPRSHDYFRLDGAKPRIVVRIYGMKKFAGQGLDIDHGGVSGARTGFHRERESGPQVHLVLDLKDPRARVVSTRIEGLQLIVRIEKG